MQVLNLSRIANAFWVKNILKVVYHFLIESLYRAGAADSAITAITVIANLYRDASVLDKSLYMNKSAVIKK